MDLTSRPEHLRVLGRLNVDLVYFRVVRSIRAGPAHQGLRSSVMGWPGPCLDAYVEALYPRLRPGIRYARVEASYLRPSKLATYACAGGFVSGDCT